MFGFMQHFEGFVEDAVGSTTETSKDDAMIQIDGCVMERQK